MLNSIKEILSHSKVLSSQWSEAHNIISVKPAGPFLEITFNDLAIDDDSGCTSKVKHSLFLQALEKYSSSKDFPAPAVAHTVYTHNHCPDFNAQGIDGEIPKYEEYHTHTYVVGPFQESEIVTSVLLSYLKDRQGNNLNLIQSDEQKKEIESQGHDAMYNWLMAAYDYGSSLEECAYNCDPSLSEITDYLKEKNLIPDHIDLVNLTECDPVTLYEIFKSKCDGKISTISAEFNRQANRDIEIVQGLIAIEQSAKFPLVLPCVELYIAARVFYGLGNRQSDNVDSALDYLYVLRPRIVLKDFITMYNLCPQYKTTLSYSDGIRYDLGGRSPVEARLELKALELDRQKLQDQRTEVEEAVAPEVLLSLINKGIEANLKNDSLGVAQSLRSMKEALCKLINLDKENTMNTQNLKYLGYLIGLTPINNNYFGLATLVLPHIDDLNSNLITYEDLGKRIGRKPHHISSILNRLTIWGFLYKDGPRYRLITDFRENVQEIISKSQYKNLLLGENFIATTWYKTIHDAERLNTIDLADLY